MNKTVQEILKEKILVLDGAMGTMIQTYNLEENDFRSKKFIGHGKDLMGNNDILSITNPDIIKEIHTLFLEAGADILETNTFGANRISQNDYDLADYVYEMNFESARIAREAADKFTLQNPDKPRFVCGILGPTNRTATMSPDIEHPENRNVSFNQLVETYKEAANALIQGGVDMIMVETVFDTLNAKAALFAVNKVREKLDSQIPVMVSCTISDASGRTLSGQTIEAFWISIKHIKPFSVGLNCSLGAKEIRPHLENLSAIAPDTLVTVHPNAGLPNELGEYDDTPENMSSVIKEFADGGLVNIVGGCCGSTPEHISKIAKTVEKIVPRNIV